MVARLAAPGSAPVVLALFALQIAASLATEQPYRAFVAHRTAVVGERVGAWLAERLAPDDWIAVNTAGSLPYVSRLPTIDMLGLTDAQIAHRPIYIVSEGWAGHRRGWGEYVLRRRPRVILWYNSAGLAEPHYLSDHELADDPFFRFFYTLRAATLAPAGDTEPDATLRRFLGFPFGYDKSGGLLDPRPRASPALPRRRHSSMTRFEEGPLRLVYFELDARDSELWQEGLRLRRRRARLRRRRSADRWARQGAPAGDPAARRRSGGALRAGARAHRSGRSRSCEAHPRAGCGANTRARSPLVPQYVANLAVMSGDLFTAVGAQKEALRLDPEQPLVPREPGASADASLRASYERRLRAKAAPSSISAAPSANLVACDIAGTGGGGGRR